MKLQIDGRQIQAMPGASLLELVNQLGLDAPELSRRPLAAKIAGEVFTLNYIPVRQRDRDTERSSIRRAMAASNGEVRLLRYGDEAGKECYLRTAWFVIFLAIRQLWPKASAKTSCTLGSSLYIEVMGVPDFSPERLKEHIAQLVAQDIPLIRRRVPLTEAMERYEADAQPDKTRLLSWRQADYFDEYCYGDFSDYYYGEMMPSTGFVTVWDVIPAENGFIFVYPDDQNPEKLADVPSMPNYFSVFSEGERWCTLMECEL